MEDNGQNPNNIPVVSQVPPKEQSPGQQLQESTQKVSSSNNSNLTNNTNTSNKPSSRMAIVYLSIISCLILCMIALVLFFPFSSLSRLQNVLNHGLTINTKTESTTPTPAIAKNGIPIGGGKQVFGSADVQGTKITIDNVIIKPTVKGDPPDKGLEYLEIDLDVSYSGNTPGSVPGIFSYLDSSENAIPSVEKKGTGNFPNKNVIVPGKIPLYELRLTKGATFKGVYLLYQIKPGDKGKLLWNYSYDPQKGYNHTFFTLFH